MRKFRFYFAIFIAKLIYFILKTTKLSSGTAIIGLITLKISPNFLEFANDYIKTSKVNITGTNGKTTTSGIITHIIKKSNQSVINNSSGANMLNGIVNSLALEINPFSNVDYSILETDEAFLSKIFDKMNSNYLLVTNLFEDQTDRFPNPLATRDIIQKGIDKQPNIQLVLNSDEPISSTLYSNIAPLFFGIKEVYDDSGNILYNPAKEVFCPICKKLLTYNKNFYSQLGHYSCECGFTRKSPKYEATVIIHKNSSTIKLEDENFEIPLTGLFNAYNALGAIVLAKELGIKDIEKNIKSFKTIAGRNEVCEFKGHQTTIQLIKNPAGTNEVLKTIDLESSILIAANNNDADGKDFSWINQVEFEKLAECNKEIVVSGICAEELKERLNKAGIKNIKSIPNINNAINYIGKTANGNITILTTYTALLKINKIKEIKKCY